MRKTSKKSRGNNDNDDMTTIKDNNGNNYVLGAKDVWEIQGFGFRKILIETFWTIQTL